MITRITYILKNSKLYMLMLFFSIYSGTIFSQCTHTLELWDTYGDGWNGGSVDLYVGGSYVGNYTLSSGSGPEYIYFTASTGQAIEIYYYAGSWAYENYYHVKDGNGSYLITDWYPSSSGTWYGTSACPSCDPITDNSVYANGTLGSITVCVGATVTISSSGGSTGNYCYWASSDGGGSWNVFQGSYCNQPSYSYVVNTVGTWIFHVRNYDGCGYCWDAGRTCTCNNCTVTVNVVNPTITCPSNIVVNATSCSGAIVNYTTPTTNCGGSVTMTGGLASGSLFPIGTTTITYTTGGYPNGAGGTFSCNPGDNNQTKALKACESVYGVGGCATGSCGYFYYYYQNGALSCDCSKPAGSYEFIYDNTGYSQVGEDYGGAATDITSSVPFTRVKATGSCDGNSWNLAQANLGSGGAPTSCSFTVTVNPVAPTHDNVTVSSSSWTTDGTHDYNITMVSTDADGFGGTYGIMALINYQGENAGQYGGYFSWHPTSYVYNGDHVVATGGGYASKYDGGYGQNTITLVGCSTSVAGNQRTVIFTVRPNSSFPQLADNDVSMYTTDACNNATGWTNWNTNFASFNCTTPTAGLISPSASALCAGSSVTINSSVNATATGATLYIEWYRWNYSNSTWTYLGQNNSQTITDNPGAGQFYYLRRAWSSCYTNCSPSCIDAVTGTVTFSPSIPATPGAITGTTPVCPGIVGLTYSISAVANATTYTWTVPAGWTINAGQGSTSLSVTSGSAGQNGNITVTAGNPCGTSSAQTKAVTVNQPIPATPGAISGTAAVCPGITGLIYSISAVPNATTYTWTVPTGWAITAGSGTNSITVTAGSAGQNGNITVTAGNSCGTSAASSLTVSVSSLSTAPTSINATVNPICNGNSTTLSVGGGSLGTGAAWKWYTGNCGGTLAGTGNSLIVSPVSTTTYYVRAEGTCNTTGCVSVTITVNTLSVAPTSINATATTICAGNSTTLNVVGGSLGTGAIWEWYSGSCGGTLVGTGSSISLSPTSTTTYYVRADGTCNTTGCSTPVTITVNSVSTVPSGISETINPVCAGNSTTMTVTGGSLGTGASWKWYSGSCGGSLVGTGSSIVVSPASTTNYYVRAEGTCNTTSCASNTITVTACILGFANYGAKIELANNAYIYVDGSSNGDFTNETTGEIINCVGTIRLEGDWTNNASSGNAFKNNTGTVEFLGDNQSIGGSVPTYFNNIRLSGTGTKTLNVNTTVGGGFASPAGILELQGLPLNLNMYTLTVTNPLSGAITRTTGYVISENEASIINWKIGTNTGSHTYPFGRFSGVARYVPFVFDITSAGTGAGSVSLSTYHSGSNNLPLPSTVDNLQGLDGTLDNSLNMADRYWKITPTNYTTIPTANISFYYEYVNSTDNEFYSPNTISEADLQAQRWDGSAWVNPPVGSANTGSHFVIVPNVNTFSPWVLVRRQNPLPIELLSFSAVCENQQVDLSWTTASELNCDRFDIEKSKDLLNWYSVGTVAGAGTTNDLQNYNYIDYSPYSGVSYYTLRQVDFDGNSETFGPVSTECIDAQTNAFEIIAIVPSETKDLLTITYNVFEDCKIQVSLIDALGQQLSAKKDNAVQGLNVFSLPLRHSLCIGIYMVTIEYNDKIFTQKIFIH